MIIFLIQIWYVGLDSGMLYRSETDLLYTFHKLFHFIIHGPESATVCFHCGPYIMNERSDQWQIVSGWMDGCFVSSDASLWPLRRWWAREISIGDYLVLGDYIVSSATLFTVRQLELWMEAAAYDLCVDVYLSLTFWLKKN